MSEVGKYVDPLHLVGTPCTLVENYHPDVSRLCWEVAEFVGRGEDGFLRYDLQHRFIEGLRKMDVHFLNIRDIPGPDLG